MYVSARLTRVLFCGSGGSSNSRTNGNLHLGSQFVAIRYNELSLDLAEEGGTGKQLSLLIKCGNLGHTLTTVSSMFFLVIFFKKENISHKSVRACMSQKGLKAPSFYAHYQAAEIFSLERKENSLAFLRSFFPHAKRERGDRKMPKKYAAFWAPTVSREYQCSFIAHCPHATHRHSCMTSLPMKNFRSKYSIGKMDFHGIFSGQKRRRV